ncbi:MAG: hypothetical protein HQ538_02100, partial [Parcubacteria group bacterium]|nr:hypothetical protein [Parcubacteria group bacterium]
IENDPDFKQPIPYGTIVNKDSGKVFAYKRAVSEPGKYDEPRLAGNWSIGIGGHVNPADYADKISARGRAADILYNAMLRESQEEVKLGRVWDRAWFRKPFTSFSLAGYINIDDQSMVNRVHFGVSYLIDTNATRAKPKDPEIEIGGFKSLDELEELYNLSQDPASGVSLEPWSKIVFPFVKQSF